MNPVTEGPSMRSTRSHSFFGRFGGSLAIAVLLTACGSASGPIGTIPVPSSSAAPSVAQGSPDVTPAPSADQTNEPSIEPSGSTGSPAPSASGEVGTSIVRSYLWLGGP